jgi:Protein of unknown function (DUF3108)
MNKNILYLFSLFLFFSCKSSELSRGERNEVESCQTLNFAFQNGEELTYKLVYSVGGVAVPAGEVTFRCEDSGGQYYITAKGRTYDSYEKIFKVDDFYESYLDKKTLLPLTSIRTVHEGKYNLYDKVVFDQKNHKATSFRGDNAEKTNKEEFDTESCMHDLISIIYFTRNLDFQHLTKGTYFPISIFMDKKAHPLQVFYKGTEAKVNIKGLGKFNTQMFAAQTISGRTFSEEAVINIWASDDENRIPLLIESPLSVGSVKAILKKYNGLAHDVSAKK